MFYPRNRFIAGVSCALSSTTAAAAGTAAAGTAAASGSSDDILEEMSDPGEDQVGAKRPAATIEDVEDGEVAEMGAEDEVQGNGDQEGSSSSGDGDLHQYGFEFQSLGPELMSSDAWDDSALIKAWDNAVKQYKSSHNGTTPKANKRAKTEAPVTISSSASSSSPSPSPSAPLAAGTTTAGSLPESEKGPGGQQKQQSTEWKVKDECMAPYSEDGQYYAASIVRITKKSGGAMIARVNFSEYGNYEDVPLDQLQAASSSSSSSASNKTSKTSSALPFPAPATMPMAPPPLSMPEDEDLANLLMAWYFSGYYTGLYQAKRHLHD